MKKGFTLIELVATISLLAIIVAMIVIDVYYFEGKKNAKERENLSSIIETTTKELVSTDETISTKVNDTLMDLEEEHESDETVEIACYINYSVLTNKNLMDPDTKYPSTSGNKIIDNKSYIIVSLNSEENYDYEFIYVDDSSTPTVTNCLN